MIYLASASPRRHELLCQAGIPHQVLEVPSPPGEDEPRFAGETPQAYVLRTAREKALRALHWLGQRVESADAVWPRSDNPAPLRPILTADTTVILGDDVLGKPQDAVDAADMLRQLSGRVHHVQTAVVLTVPVENSAFRFHEDVSDTEVVFKTLTEQEIDSYCASGEPMGKAGAYGIQGRAATFVARISGSYTGVVGLPLFETARLLQKGGVSPL